MASVIGQYKNRGRTLIDGFDVDARGRFDLGEWGRLNIGVAATVARRNMYNFDDGDGWYYGSTYGVRPVLCFSSALLVSVEDEREAGFSLSDVPLDDLLAEIKSRTEG